MSTSLGNNLTPQNPNPELRTSDVPPGLMYLTDIAEMREVLPFTATLFPEGTETGQIPLPSIEAINDFAATYLQPIGATTMRVEQVSGSEFSARQLVDCINDGIIPAATDPKLLAHDIVDHAIGAKTLPEITTQVFRQVTGLARALRETNAEDAVILEKALSNIFDYRASVGSRYLKRVQNYTEEPIILTHLSNFIEKFDDRRYADKTKLANIARIKEAIEATIDDIPVEPGVSYEASTKLGRWAEWEARNLPAYTAAVREVLSQRPPQHLTRLQRIAGALGIKARQEPVT